MCGKDVAASSNSAGRLHFPDLLKSCPAHEQMVKSSDKSWNSTYVLVSQFLVNEVSPEIFQMVENSSRAEWAFACLLAWGDADYAAFQSHLPWVSVKRGAGVGLILRRPRRKGRTENDLGRLRIRLGRSRSRGRGRGRGLSFTKNAVLGSGLGLGLASG